MSQKEFVDFTKEVLLDELNRPDKIAGLTDELIHDAVNEMYSEAEPRGNIFGYPTRPVYRELGHLLHAWLTTKECPVLRLPRYELLSEQSYEETRMANILAINPLLEGLEALWSCWNSEEKKFRIREILLILGVRGMLDLLGLRKTVGTLEVWPPPRQILVNSMEDKHSDRASLSVGARALAKHGHRDETASWWGVSKGSETAKNNHASGVLKRILDGAHWINIHQIVHDQKLLEVRQGEGYGARWSHDGTSFRGFLEPQMEGGHEVGWKH